MCIFKTLMVALCAAIIASASAQDNVNITIKGRTDVPAQVVVISPLKDFEKKLSLSMGNNRPSAIEKVFIKALSDDVMVDANGIAITSDIDVDVAKKIAVGFSGGTSEIISSTVTPTGISVVASFKDADGNYVSPPVDSLAAYDTSGKKLCFDYKTVEQAPPKMTFKLLLDKSYSMVNVMVDVKRTAKHFLTNVLPPEALCGVAAFDTALHPTHNTVQSCGGGGFHIDAIELGGGTDIYKALKHAYKEMSNPFLKDHQKAVIVVTDGVSEIDAAQQKELIALKGETLTFVYLLGVQAENAVKAVTDSFISQGNEKIALGDYFDVIGKAYRTQKVLNITQCSP